MRRQTGLLMDGDEPAGGQWNFDAENRKPAADDLFMPRAEALRAGRDHAGGDGAGRGALRRPFRRPRAVRLGGDARAGARRRSTHFVDDALPRFGDYQDAMLAGEPFLYHALISPYLNVGLLDPLRRLPARRGRMAGGRRAAQRGRGLHPPDHRLARICARHLLAEDAGLWRACNFFGATRALPGFYWTGETEMDCMRARGRARRATMPMPTTSSG